MTGLLSGYCVLESSMLLNGAATTMMLVDLGAEVIKVESPFLGDYLRIEDTWHLHAQANKGKRSIALDLRKPAAREVFDRLLARADVFVSNAIANRNDKLGLGYAQLRAKKPDLIYCQNTGFGATGPYAELPTHGQMMDALAGALPAEMGEDGLTHQRRQRPRSLTLESGGEATAAGAIYAAFHIAAALAHRERTREGCYIDIAAASAVLASGWAVASKLANRPDRRAPSDADLRGIARYQWYRTRDRKFVLFCPEEKKFWEKFCDLVARPELKAQVHGIALRRELQAIFDTRDRADWLKLAIDNALPLGPAHDGIDEVRADPQIQARGILYEEGVPGRGRVLLVGQPALVDGRAAREARPAPALGEHTAEILAELGYSKPEIERLAAGQVTTGAAPAADYIADSFQAPKTGS
jgi:crotonobetainyl-CoA:carnitine CoA-transferase CaiB-like acyl-CoA transferase